MNQTNGDSKVDIVFMSSRKEKEPGIKVRSAGKKDNILGENMVFSVGNAEILKNGTIKTELGQIIAQKANYAQVKENNENRPTEHSLEVARKEGKIKNFMKSKAERERKMVDLNKAKTRKQKEDAQELA